MPAKRSTTKSKTNRKTKTEPIEPEVLVNEESVATDECEMALARVNRALATKDGNAQGIISEQRAYHSDSWQELMAQDGRTRSQILQLKAKENEVLTAIRNRVASNLMETLDVATEQGLLEATEEV
ncbi:hypothetical protein ACFL2Q_05140 [Thermodesulfobacteriota bacterium]